MEANIVKLKQQIETLNLEKQIEMSRLLREENMQRDKMQNDRMIFNK